MELADSSKAILEVPYTIGNFSCAGFVLKLVYNSALVWISFNILNITIKFCWKVSITYICWGRSYNHLYNSHWHPKFLKYNLEFVTQFSVFSTSVHKLRVFWSGSPAYNIPWQECQQVPRVLFQRTGSSANAEEVTKSK